MEPAIRAQNSSLLSDDVHAHSRPYATEPNSTSTINYAAASADADTNVGKFDKAGATQIRVAHLHSSNGIYGAEQWTATQIRHLDRNVVKAS